MSGWRHNSLATAVNFFCLCYTRGMLTHITLDPGAVDLFLKLGGALLCGVIIGTERNISHKAAGMRTYALVAMGAALFVIIGDLALRFYATSGLGTLVNGFPVIGAIVSGIGFMGAGVIMFRERNVTGLTTASGLWVAAGIGMACGYGFYVPAFMATLLTLFVFEVLWHVEQRVKKVSALIDPSFSEPSDKQ